MKQNNHHHNKSMAALRAAIPITLPICAAFSFLGLSYGLYSASEGFSFWYPMITSALIFAGAMEFVTITLLLSPFNPVAAFLMALMVNSRHLFYGLSMLEKFRGTGWKKFFLIFGMCDETFAINCTVDPGKDIDKGYFMMWVTFLNQLYWVVGSTIGGILGNNISINTKGLDFALVALFMAIFVSQWQSSENHGPAIVGLVLPTICLIFIGPAHFIPPAMLLIIISFIIVYYKGSVRSHD